MGRLRDLLEKRREELKVICVVGDKEYDVDLYDELAILPGDDILEHIDTYPGLLAWWGLLLIRAQDRFRAIEERYNMWWAETYEKEYKRLQQEEGKRPNINSVENAILLKYQKEYLMRRTELDSARQAVQVLEFAVECLQEKGQMIIQRSKQRMAELGAFEGSGSTLNENNDKER